MFSTTNAADVSGAALDLFHSEPLPDGHLLWDHTKVVVTAHVAGGSGFGSIRQVAENYRRALAGESLIDQAVRALGY